MIQHFSSKMGIPCFVGHIFGPTYRWFTSVQRASHLELSPWEKVLMIRTQCSSASLPVFWTQVHRTLHWHLTLALWKWSHAPWKPSIHKVLLPWWWLEHSVETSASYFPSSSWHQITFSSFIHEVVDTVHPNNWLYTNNNWLYTLIIVIHNSMHVVLAKTRPAQWVTLRNI